MNATLPELCLGLIKDCKFFLREVKKQASLTAILLVLGLTLACGAGSANSSGGPNQAPTIAAFSSTPAVIETGGSTTLAWSVTDATSLTIDTGNGPLSSQNSVTVSANSVSVTPSTTTTYTLTAKNAIGSTTATAVVAVVDRPTISSFTATPAVINPGESSTLSWSMSGITTLSLDNGIGPVSGTSVTVNPIQTTTYTLTGTNAAGTIVSVKATVAVVVPPTILSFTATPLSISTGQSSTLRFSVSGATNISIDNGIGTVTGTHDAYSGVTGSVVVNPTATTTYTITASNTVSGFTASVTAQATVTFSNAFIPTISSFTASAPSLGPGGSVMLTPTFDEGPGGTASVDQGIGSVTTGVPVSSGTLNSSTTFKLTVTNGSNSATSDVRVTVGDLALYAGRLLPNNLFGPQPSPGSSDGPGLNGAAFDLPRGLAVDASGNIYVADSANHTIRMIDTADNVTTIAGTAGNQGFADGVGSAAVFNNPTAVAVDKQGNVYVADSGNNLIRVIAPGGIVSTLAGSAGIAGTTDGTGTGALFNDPTGLALDSSGNLFVADSGSNTIRRIAPGGVVTTYAGVANQIGNVDSSNPLLATFNQPNGLAVDSSGNLYVANTKSHAIRKITPAGQVSTFAGMAGTAGGYADGNGTAAQFNLPFYLAFDPFGNLFVTENSGNNTIRRISPSGDVSTVIGQAAKTNTVPSGPLPGTITTPQGIAINPLNGTLYFSMVDHLIVSAPY